MVRAGQSVSCWVTSDDDEVDDDVSEASVTSSVHDVLTGACVTLTLTAADSVNPVTSLASDNTTPTITLSAA